MAALIAQEEARDGTVSSLDAGRGGRGSAGGGGGARGGAGGGHAEDEDEEEASGSSDGKSGGESTSEEEEEDDDGDDDGDDDDKEKKKKKKKKKGTSRTGSSLSLSLFLSLVLSSFSRLVQTCPLAHGTPSACAHIPCRLHHARHGPQLQPRDARGLEGG